MGDIDHISMSEYQIRDTPGVHLGVKPPKISRDIDFEIKDQFLRELEKIQFSGSEGQDANRHVKEVERNASFFHMVGVSMMQ